jgi:hypothetical protein
MGVWEEAQKRSTEQAAQDRARAAADQKAKAEGVAAQSRAVHEFVEAMRRLEIKPLRYRFWMSYPGSGLSRSIVSVTGWCLESPCEKIDKPWTVVTPEADVYRMENKAAVRRPKPLDLSQVQTFGLDPSISLVEKLTESLTTAMRGR